MVDATAGAAAAALAGGANPGDAATGAAATTTEATTTTNSAEAANDTWYSKLAPEHQGLLEKKGWNKPDGLAEVIKNYADLERQYRSGDKVLLPKDANDTEALNRIYDKLGRPESPDKYKFPEGVDPGVVKELAPQLHKLGITQPQAEALAKLDLSRAEAAQAQFVEAAKKDSDAAMAKLEGEWGNKTPENIEFNRRAMRALGITVDEATRYMASAGAEKFMRLLNAAGKAMREENGSVLSGDNDLGFGMTKNRAAAEVAELKGNKDFMQRLHKGDKAANEKWKQLHKIAAGEA